VRTFLPETQRRIRDGIERIASGVAEAHGTTARLEYTEGYAPVVNDPAVAAIVERAARAELGEDAVAPPEPIMAAEDFSAYQRVVPGAFFTVGAGNELTGVTFPHHHPRFAIDEASLAVGIAVLARTALDVLA